MLNLIARTVIIFLMLLTLMRLMGKRQLGELELSELVVSIMAADAASVPLQDPQLSILYGIIPCVTLFACEFLLSWLTMVSVTARRVACGQPCFLVVGGVIQQKAMRRCRFTLDELAEELRNQNVTDISTVQYAVLETDGTLNVILIPEERPVTVGQMGIALKDDGYAIILISDGTLMRRNLVICGKDMAWLQHELHSRHCDSIRQVYAFILFESGKIFFATKER